jgi:acyl-CoA synthetase (AMP-forming)/AMP-acid ligase II
MSPRELFALRDYLGPELSGRTICDAAHVVSLTDILSQSCLGGRVAELSGRSVLLSTSGQLLAALAMIELDGIARCILPCPPDLNSDHVPDLIEDAGIEAIVTDEPLRWSDAGVYLILGAHLPEGALKSPPKTERATEWLMLTSGTSGAPKIVGYTLEGLCGTIVACGPARGEPPVWATFHDIRRDGGLQILLRAIVGGGSMVLSEHGEELADHVARLSARGVTHISGTPSHWRELLMSGAAAGFSPRHVRLSGKIADPAVLDGLIRAFPNASVDAGADASPAAC